MGTLEVHQITRALGGPYQKVPQHAGLGLLWVRFEGLGLGIEGLPFRALSVQGFGLSKN